MKVVVKRRSGRGEEGEEEEREVKAVDGGGTGGTSRIFIGKERLYEVEMALQVPGTCSGRARRQHDTVAATAGCIVGSDWRCSAGSWPGCRHAWRDSWHCRRPSSALLFPSISFHFLHPVSPSTRSFSLKVLAHNALLSTPALSLIL